MSTQLQPGNEISIKITARNNGFSYENFTVSLLNGENKIGEQPVQNLPPQTNTNLFFEWDTSGLSPNTYNIKALATLATNETNKADNSMEEQITLIPGTTPQVATSSLMLPLAVVGTTAVLSPVGLIVYKKKKTRSTPKAITAKNKIPKKSNYAQFKEMIGGDFPPGSTILISGSPGAGKSILSQFLTCHLLNEGKACIFVTYDELPRN
jgi:hypothetical protein